VERDGQGHTFIEIRKQERWVAYDIDRKLRWTDEAGRGLSMAEYIARVPSRGYRIVALLGRSMSARSAGRCPLRARAFRPPRRPAVVSFTGCTDGPIITYAPDYRVLPVDEWEARFGERVVPV
jgi:hypothetical protein